ncbi:hypothetical protein AB0450_32995, partial [Streptomyces sp. NPDC093808]
MIVWPNGPFGGGKTTLADELCRAVPGATVADPKAVGDPLRSTLTGHALRPRDYQDLPLWRPMTGAFVTGLTRHTGGPVIVPMTILNPAYAEEGAVTLSRGVVLGGVSGRAGAGFRLCAQAVAGRPAVPVICSRTAK